SLSQEKVNTVRRILLGLEAAGVAEVLVMPDTYAIGERALDGLPLSLRVEALAIPVFGDAADTTRAAAMMAQRGVGCIVTVGGDGTNRAVAKGCGSVPIVAVSTGTNNVFPTMVEGTLAGMAAGLVATGQVGEEAITPTKRLEVMIDGRAVDLALVDVVTCRSPFAGARAIWRPDQVEEVVLARAEPGQMGLSAIGAHLLPLSAADARGLYLRLGEGPLRVRAPIAPGLVADVSVHSYRPLAQGETVELTPGPCTVALDGERELEITGQRLAVRLGRDGPRLVDVQACLRQAAQQGLWRSGSAINDGGGQFC
ncbi:MAG: NAD(+)/NADH kinase, partial [Dehalococcoidia bacterium]